MPTVFQLMIKKVFIDSRERELAKEGYLHL